MKKALVIGCTGQDGSLISKSLLDKGFEVFGTTRDINQIINNHETLQIKEHIRLEKLDIYNSDVLKKLIVKIDPDEIYHLAAESSVGKSFDTPKITFESICTATINLLETARKLGLKSKIFFAGSGEIYGETKFKANLNHKLNPFSPYAIAKIASMQMVKQYRSLYKIPAVTGILFNHESNLRAERFVTKKIIKGALLSQKNKNHKIQLGNIKIERDWGLAEEFVEAMQLQLRSDKNCDQIICTGQKASLEYFIQKSFELLNLNWKDHIQINKEFYRPMEINNSFGDPTQMRKDTGWFAKYKIDAVIEDLIDKESRQLRVNY